jgi:hypothetical protein
VTEVTEPKVEAATVAAIETPAGDPIAAAKAEAEAILAAAKREAALIAQGAREEAAAAKAKAADWQALPDAPPAPLPEGVMAAPEPSVSAQARAGRAVGTVIETGVSGITRIDY